MRTCLGAPLNRRQAGAELELLMSLVAGPNRRKTKRISLMSVTEIDLQSRPGNWSEQRERKLRRYARRKGLFLIRLRGAARGKATVAYAIIPERGTLNLAEAEAIISGKAQ